MERRDLLGVGEPGAEVVERADASRNRVRVLSAAAELFRARGVAAVTMDDIASEAGVGRATLYRRYPDRAAIAAALLDGPERELQQRMVSGPPPLGPGAPPGARLAAFYRAMVEFLDRHGHLALGIEVGHSRLTTGAYGFWRGHVRVLLREAQHPHAEVLGDTLLAPLAPEVIRHQRLELDLPLQAISDALAELAHRVVGDDRRHPVGPGSGPDPADSIDG